MNILFVQTNTVGQLMPLPIGAAMAAKHLERSGHRVRFLDLMGERDPVATARRVTAESLSDTVLETLRKKCRFEDIERGARASQTAHAALHLACHDAASPELIIRYRLRPGMRLHAIPGFQILRY